MICSHDEWHILDVLNCIFVVNYHAWIVKLLRLAHVLIVHIMQMLGIWHSSEELLLGVHWRSS